MNRTVFATVFSSSYRFCLLTTSNNNCTVLAVSNMFCCLPDNVQTAADHWLLLSASDVQVWQCPYLLNVTIHNAFMECITYVLYKVNALWSLMMYLLFFISSFFLVLFWKPFFSLLEVPTSKNRLTWIIQPIFNTKHLSFFFFFLLLLYHQKSKRKVLLSINFWSRWRKFHSK